MTKRPQRIASNSKQLTLVASNGARTPESRSLRPAASRKSFREKGRAMLRVVSEKATEPLERNVAGSIPFMRDVSAELHHCGEVTTAGKPKTIPYDTCLLFGESFYDGDGSELQSELVALVLAGDSCFGLVNSRINDDELPYATSLVLLAVGHGAGNLLPSGVQHPAGLAKEFDYDDKDTFTYHVDRWDTLNGQDATVALEGSEQFTLATTPSEAEIVVDAPTNPTFVLDSEAYERMIAKAKAQRSPHTKFNDFVFYLQSNPQVWDPNYLPTEED